MESLKECKICPRECRADRTSEKLGYCKMDYRIKIARADLHFWEEPCLSGKTGSGTVFFSGCNMDCVFCQNYKISHECKGKCVSIDELCDIFLMLQEKKAHNINLVTAVHFVPQVIKALEMAKEKGLKIPIVYNSGGYEKPETLKCLDGLVDIYLPDFKYYDDKYAIKYSNAKNYCETAKKAIAEMVRQTGKNTFDKDGIMKRGVIVRHMLLPGLLFDSKKIVDYLYTTYKNDIWISLMNQYTPLEKAFLPAELKKEVSQTQYEALIRYAQKIGVENAFIQEEGTVSESFIPEFWEE